MECTSGMQCEPGSLQDHDYFASFSSRETWRCRIGELGGRQPGASCSRFKQYLSQQNRYSLLVVGGRTRGIGCRHFAL